MEGLHVAVWRREFGHGLELHVAVLELPLVMLLRRDATMPPAAVSQAYLGAVVVAGSFALTGHAECGSAIGSVHAVRTERELLAAPKSASTAWMPPVPRSCLPYPPA